VICSVLVTFPKASKARCEARCLQADGSKAACDDEAACRLWQLSESTVKVVNLSR
jgi:hypothetical protein